MSKRSLITGGTSGLGAQFARTLAAEGSDLVLVARDAGRLQAVAQELAAAHGIDVETIVADLSSEADVARVEARLADEERPVDLLVNNAGFGASGSFVSTPGDVHQRMVDVNVGAVVRLAHAALEVMMARGSGDVINVGSVAAFTPGLRPSSTYAATKAFVVALTEGMAPTLAGTGVHMSVLCPGWVRTEFHTRAGIDMSKLPSFLWLEPERVVRAGLSDHRAGRVVSVPGWQYKVIVLAMKLAPGGLMRRATRHFGRRAH